MDVALTQRRRTRPAPPSRVVVVVAVVLRCIIEIRVTRAGRGRSSGGDVRYVRGDSVRRAWRGRAAPRVLACPRVCAGRRRGGA